jgi:F-type H+-transporting ATPase subunit b
MLTNPTFWFMVSFILFFVFFGRAVWSAVTQGLDNRSIRIETDIQEAMAARERAETLLHDIKRKQLEASQHAEAIIEHARLEAERLRTEASNEMEEYMKQRELLVEQRIEFAEKEALKNIRDTAVRMAAEASEKIMKKVVTSDVNKQISDKAISELGSALRS